MSERSDIFDMITFKISLILAFALKSKLEVTRKQSEKVRINGMLGRENKKSQKTKNFNNDQVEVLPEDSKYIFRMDKAIGVAHIEYELIPDKIKYQIDVKCWGPIAKIFTNDEQLTLKIITGNDMAWVPICLEHYLDNISIDGIKNLRNYIVNFDISSNANKLGKLATADKSNTFYALEKEADWVDRYFQVFEQDPNLQEKDTELRNSLKVIKRVSLSKNDFKSRLNYSPHNFDVIYDIINKHCAGADLDCKHFVLPCSPDLSKKVKISEQNDSKLPRGQTSKSASKKNETVNAKSGNIVVSAPAEVLFTDPNLAIYKEESKNDVVKNVYVLLSVDQLLSRTQKLLLDPLVIKVKKLSNLPVDILKQLGITSIYTAYDIPAIATCKGIEKPVMENIKFNEAHIFFNDNVSKLKLIEFIQTRKLHVEIYGIRTLPPSELNPLLFGNEIDDKNIWKIKPFKKFVKNTNEHNTPVLLAVCTYDISSVIQNIWDFQEKGQCHEPELTLYQKCMGFYDTINFSDMINVNEVNINQNHLKAKNLVLEETLLNFGTTLKVEVYLMAPQTASLILLRIPNTFKRFLFILYNWELARNLLTGIIKHNEEIISENKTSSAEDLEFTDIITGFMIDNGISLTIFVEGLSAGFILSIENITITNYEVGRGKFFFNTDTVFERRLYNTFLREGLSIITLRIPLSNILSNQKIYIKGNVPVTCLEALKKLHLLFYSSSYKSILQFNLLPKPEELLSLNFEWAVPLMVKKDNGKL